jgi:hypothetical protein
MRRLVDEVLAEVRLLPGVEETRSRWGEGTAFGIDGHEFFHCERDGLLDIRMTRRLIRDLDDDRVVYRPGSSDWVWLTVESPEDVSFAVELARRARAANAAA